VPASVILIALHWIRADGVCSATVFYLFVDSEHPELTRANPDPNLITFAGAPNQWQRQDLRTDRTCSKTKSSMVGPQTILVNYYNITLYKGL